MTDDSHDPKSGAPRKRPGPTIDLTATEITPEPKAETSADTGSRFTSSQANTDKKAEAPGGVPPRSGYSMRDASGRFFSNLPWPAVVAAGAGAIAVFLAGLWAGGVVSDNAANEKLVRLEAQLNDAANRPVVVDAKSLDELSLRLAKIETASRADPALAGRIAALEASIRAAAESAASRERRADELAAIAREARANTSDVARTDIDALVARIAALEQATRSNESELAKRATDDPKSRLAIAASALRDAVERGGGFAAELAAAKSLTADSKTLAPLEGFAASGIPNAAALGRELSALIPALTKGAGREPREGGFLERLQANAEKLVRIRPVGEIAGDEPDRIVARIEVKAASADIGGASDELAKLPAAIRAPAEPWIKKAATRNAAILAARQFAQGALAAIRKSGS